MDLPAILDRFPTDLNSDDFVERAALSVLNRFHNYFLSNGMAIKKYGGISEETWQQIFRKTDELSQETIGKNIVYLDYNIPELTQFPQGNYEGKSFEEQFDKRHEELHRTTLEQLLNSLNDNSKGKIDSEKFNEVNNWFNNDWKRIYKDVNERWAEDLFGENKPVIPIVYAHMNIGANLEEIKRHLKADFIPLVNFSGIEQYRKDEVSATESMDFSSEENQKFMHNVNYCLNTLGSTLMGYQYSGQKIVSYSGWLTDILKRTNMNQNWNATGWTEEAILDEIIYLGEKIEV